MCGLVGVFLRLPLILSYRATLTWQLSCSQGCFILVELGGKAFVVFGTYSVQTCSFAFSTHTGRALLGPNNL